MFKKLFAEFTGTFFIVFLGTGSIVINTLYNGILGSLGIAIVFGLAVAIMIFLFGAVSGAHFNPAVSFGFYLAGRFNKNLVFPYIFFQFLGAISASLILKLIFPNAQTLGNTFSSTAIYWAFFTEIIISFLLMVVILWTSKGSWKSGIITAFIVGVMVFLAAFFAGSISGASMNPARSLGPAIASWNFKHLFLYLCAPFLGVGLAAFLFKKLGR